MPEFYQGDNVVSQFQTSLSGVARNYTENMNVIKIQTIENEQISYIKNSK